jgi:hypothetical protein
VDDDKDVIPLSRFQAILSRARGTKRLDFLLAQPDAASLIAELPVQDLYYLIKEVGVGEAHEVLAMATPEQVQSFLDLDAWREDRLEIAQARPWLAALIDAGPDKVAQVWRELDPELAALLIARSARVYNIVEEDVPEDEEPPFYPTPDRFFLVKITAEEAEDVRIVERTLDHLYRADAELARHILRSAQTETLAYLEETSHRFRSGRMQDLGYADYYEALEVFRPLTVGQGGAVIGEGTADRPADPQSLPAPLGDPALRRGFFGRVLREITLAEEARRIEGALIALFNRVLAADRVSPADLELARGVAERAAATVSLGLEAVARADLARGVEALRSISLTRLHRVGYTLGLRLVKLLDALGPRTAHAEEPQRSLIDALRLPRPAFPRALDDPPSAGVRPLTTLADLARVTSLLADLAAQIRLVYDLLQTDPAKLGDGITLGDVIRSAVVQAALERPPRFAPVTPSEVLAYQRLDAEVVRARAQAAFPREYAETLLGFLAGTTVVAE